MQTCKYGLDELMEIIDVFEVPKETQARVKELLAQENAMLGIFFAITTRAAKLCSWKRNLRKKAAPSMSWP